MPKYDNCNHPNCYGGPCKQLTDEELTLDPEDIALAEQLVAEGWKSTSHKYRMVARHRDKFRGVDLVHPDMLETDIGKFIVDQWESGRWADNFLRVGKDTYIERRELTVKQFKAFRKLGGQGA